LSNVDILNKVLNKHVTIFRKDGNVLQGFILSVSEDYVEMVELDNNTIIFDRGCIDLIRQGVTFEDKAAPQKSPEVNMQKEIVISKRVSKPVDEVLDFPEDVGMSSCQDEFSMCVKDTPYTVPSFLRTTERDE
jgi:hypothetical protein